MLGEKVPSDVKKLCPRFLSLSDEQRREFWAFFFQAMSVAESSLYPRDRYKESGIPGTDSVTKRAIWSEGLLQVSYQDNDIYDCDFDWGADRGLPATHPSKTIFEPARNLRCGINILNRQIIVRGNPLFTSKNWYWSVLTKRSSNAGYRRLMAEMSGIPKFCK